MQLPSVFPKDVDTATSKPFARVVAWIVGLGLVALATPIILTAVTGVFGIITAVGVSWLALKAAPVFSIITTNLALKAIRWEARRNPVETKMQLYSEDLKTSQEFEKECQEFNNEVESHRSRVEKFVERYPDQAQSFLDELRDYEQLRQARYDALNDLKANLVLQSEDIERASAIWDMTKANDRMSKLAGRLTEKDATKQIMESEANKAIEDGRARSRAALIHLKNIQAGAHKPAPKAPVAIPQSSAPDLLFPNKDNVYVPASQQPVERKMP